MMSGPRQIGPNGMTAFVPNGSGGYSRKDLAVILLGAAEEAGLDRRRAVRATNGGFFISDELAALLYDEQASAEQAVEDEPEVSGNAVEADPDPEPETKAPAKKSTSKKSTSKKASGNRAAKNSTAEKE